MAAQNTSASSTGKQSPSEFLAKLLGGPVLVKLITGTEYSGTLQCLDDRMNIALESAKEYSTRNTVSAEYKTALIRGNNVLYISEYSDESER